MNLNNIYEFKKKALDFVNSLETKKDFIYIPVKYGFTKYGLDIELGFSCFAIKSLYILDEWKNLNHQIQCEWINYLNSFQIKNFEYFPDGSFIDQNYFKFINSYSISKETKRQFKKIIYGKNNIKKKEIEVKEFIRAESKQAISTLYQIKSENTIPYVESHFQDLNVERYLNSLNWEKPWNAGAQYAALCVFLETQMKKDKNYISIKNELLSFSDKISNKETGCYFLGKPESSSELINGTMKIISGFDWINLPIHYPEQLIDFCLSSTISSYGCDIVDVVYVLFMCSKQTSHRRLEIESYFDKIEAIIAEHYFSEIGGFSYYKNKSQIYYYGLNITKGKNEPDLHGTTLLLWAVSLIYEFKNPNQKQFNLIKP